MSDLAEDVSLSFLKAEMLSQEALAQKYRASIQRAIEIGVPRADGTYRGPWGNARDPEEGWHYSPRITKAAIKAEAKASHLKAVIEQMEGLRG